MKFIKDRNKKQIHLTNACWLCVTHWPIGMKICISSLIAERLGSDHFAYIYLHMCLMWWLQNTARNRKCWAEWHKRLKIELCAYKFMIHSVWIVGEQFISEWGLATTRNIFILYTYTISFCKSSRNTFFKQISTTRTAKQQKWTTQYTESAKRNVVWVCAFLCFVNSSWQLSAGSFYTPCLYI